MAVPGHRLDRMFNPKTVVVIGDKGPNFMWLKNSLAFRESGGEIYSVQLDPKEIEGIEKLGVKNFLSLEEVPGEIDYALVAVPRPIAPLILKGLIANNVQGAGFFTSGFAETGEEEGIKLQEQLTEMAREANFALVGPNCMGLYLPQVGVRFNGDVPVTKDGRVGFMSQSGTHAIGFSLLTNSQGIQLTYCISMGNCIALDIPDYLDYLTQDDQTEVIGIYAEGVRDGRRFFEALREACKKKPVVVWKGGQSQAGSRATYSHSSSLATPLAVWESMIRQCGAIATHSLDETVDVVKMLTMSKRPTGRGMALLAQTGGQSVAITDAFSTGGFEVPNFTEGTYEKLGEFFNIIGGSYRNPLDMGGTVQGSSETLDKILRIVDADPNVDIIAMEASGTFAARQWKENPGQLANTLDTIGEHLKRSEKPFVMTIHPAHEAEYIASIQPEFNKRGIPTFPSFERAAAALNRMAEASGV